MEISVWAEFQTKRLQERVRCGLVANLKINIFLFIQCMYLCTFYLNETYFPTPAIALQGLPACYVYMEESIINFE